MSIETIYLEELPYSSDSCALFERLRELPHALLLDSGHPHTLAGRFDIMTADPLLSFELNPAYSSSYQGMHEYFLEIAKVHSSFCKDLVTPTEEIPFCGGIAGYLDYESGRPLLHLASAPQARSRLHFYEWAVIQDHLLQRCTFAALPSQHIKQRQDLLALLHQPATATAAAASGFRLRKSFESNMSPQQYRQAIERIQNYITAGDCYQVNLAQRFSSSFDGDPWSAYQQLRPLAAAHFSGYMENPGDSSLLCLSPERFLKLAGQRVEARPIKGTRPRHTDAAADRASADELRHSAKDRAENLMIVDLLRNDLGHNCRPGSIQVERLFELESYPTVHHLVSTICGELRPECSAVDLLRDSFPGGSITGAPKRRAMEIIEELEPDPRSAYCGSMLYISADGRMDSNIAIRSLLCEQDQIFCWGGGGIVADSQWEQEYQETWDKVGRFIEALETTLVES
jgi:para-aminobenzoate synthetase component 1